MYITLNSATESNDANFSNNFSDILDSDAVIIASPNHTHFNYIEQLLKGFSGYIFSEKPPVTSGKELAKLNSKSSNDKARIFFLLGSFSFQQENCHFLRQTSIMVLPYQVFFSALFLMT